jgi:hypothetical protein
MNKTTLVTNFDNLVKEIEQRFAKLGKEVEEVLVSRVAKTLTGSDCVCSYCAFVRDNPEATVVCKVEVNFEDLWAESLCFADVDLKGCFEQCFRHLANLEQTDYGFDEELVYANRWL